MLALNRKTETFTASLAQDARDLWSELSAPGREITNTITRSSGANLEETFLQFAFPSPLRVLANAVQSGIENAMEAKTETTNSSNASLERNYADQLAALALSESRTGNTNEIAKATETQQGADAQLRTGRESSRFVDAFLEESLGGPNAFPTRVTDYTRNTNLSAPRDQDVLQFANGDSVIGTFSVSDGQIEVQSGTYRYADGGHTNLRNFTLPDKQLRSATASIASATKAEAVDDFLRNELALAA